MIIIPLLCCFHKAVSFMVLPGSTNAEVKKETTAAKPTSIAPTETSTIAKIPSMSPDTELLNVQGPGPQRLRACPGRARNPCGSVC